MFTGIVENLAEIRAINKVDINIHIQFKCDIISELKIDQSIAHNGICLTIHEIKDDLYTVIAIPETIQKTTVSNWKVGDKINIERALKIGDRLDGHWVQGHVDDTIILIDKDETEKKYTFFYNPIHNKLIVEKGSVCIDGISLTSFDVKANSFCIALIPYTLENTMASNWNINSKSNIEFDFFGKMIQKQLLNHLK